MKHLKKILLIYCILVIAIIWISSQKWTPSFEENLKTINLIFYFIIICITFFVIAKTQKLWIRIIVPILTLIILIPFYFFSSKDEQNKHFITNIDNYYFYYKDAFPSSGNELIVYQRNKNLPTMKRLFLKQTFNIGDSISIKKEKDERIHIKKTLINKVFDYYLDTEKKEICLNKNS